LSFDFMPVLSSLKPWFCNRRLLFGMVLLMVPILSGCGKRTILGSTGPKGDKKLVVGTMVVSPSPASNPGRGAGFTGKNTATVWFTRADGDRLTYVPEERHCPHQFTDSNQALSFALTELLAGPEGRGQGQALSSATPSPTSSEIPVGTVLIKVQDDQATGSITVDLSRRFVQGGGTDSFEARLEQLKRTIAGVAGARAVYLNIEGERLTASGDGLEVKQPVNGDADFRPDSN
jgi:spore germination protein GerM